MALTGSSQWQQDDSEDDDGESVLGSSTSSGSTSSAPPTTTTYAQFQGESDEDEEDEDEEDDSGDGGSTSKGEEASEEEDSRKETILRKKLATVPFGALIKAQRSFSGASQHEQEDLSDFEEEDEWATDRALAREREKKRGKTSTSTSTSMENPSMGDLAEKRRLVNEKLQAMRSAGAGPSSTRGGAHGSGEDGEDEERHKRVHREVQKRSSKHAPTEMSSRKPVSRKRSVIETTSRDSRDPRFSTLSGNEVNQDLFRKSYSFLPEMQHQEISTLRKTLGRLKKAETHQAGPKARSESALKIREEREKVERALKRAEAKEAERQKREREREVMKSFKRENEERVQRGGKRFYLKDSAKREILLQDKFSRLAGKKREGADGQSQTTVEGSTSSSSKALRKALDKRRKKNAAKERKTMPFLEAGRRGGPDGSGSGQAYPPPRRPTGDSGSGGKRKR